MAKGIVKTKARKRRHWRIRKRVVGTPQRPRLSVFRSERHISAQLIDDTAGVTLVAASTLAQDLRSAKGSIQTAQLVGSRLANKALEKKIEKVVFDKSGYQYHGRVKALAEGARQGGLKF